MAVSMTARWDNNGTVIPGGDAEYVVAEQPIAEYDNWFNYNIVADIQAVIDDVINKFNANTILKADADNTPAALVVAEQTIVGRKTGSSIAALTAAEVRTIINVENAADVTDSTNVNAAGAVMESDFNATTFLYATSDNTPQPKNVAETLAILNVDSGADVTGSNPPQAHNQSATTITAGTLVVARGGTGVTGSGSVADVNATKVDGCSAGTGESDVYKIPTGGYYSVYYHGAGTGVIQLSPGTEGHQLTTHSASGAPTWAASSDLIFSDTHCPKCGQEFHDGDDLILHVIGHNEVGDILTIPMHLYCANEPKKTIVLEQKVMEDTYIIDELTGELKIQRVSKTQEKVVTKHTLKEGYVIDRKSGKAHKLNEDGGIDKSDLLLSDAVETTEEIIHEIVYEDVEFEL